jgi:sulfite reductase (NADPH) flavoprotein alpha-component
MSIVGYSKDYPLSAKVIEERLLTRPGSDRETKHLAVDIAGSGIQYSAGDSLGVWPSNRPVDVDEILHSLKASGNEPVTIPHAAGPIPLRSALAHRLALADPTRRFAETLAGAASDPASVAKLKGLLEPDAKELLAEFLGQREYVDLLTEFPSARIGPQVFVDHLRRLMPRLYSIASSSRLFPGQVHLTVDVVKYKTNDRERFGVCSNFLGNRAQVGVTEVPVFVAPSHFRLPSAGDKDVIMVGPGTGIAPFRAFVQERVAAGATGRNWLFFGNRHRGTDFLYEEEWTEALAQGRLARLDAVFSRDQPTKAYVQDRMRENAAEMWRWIANGAHFYVCGDAHRMAKDVDAALREIVAQEGRMSPPEAAEYVVKMKKDSRYQRDVY